MSRLGAGMLVTHIMFAPVGANTTLACNGSTWCASAYGHHARSHAYSFASAVPIPAQTVDRCAITGSPNSTSETASAEEAILDQLQIRVERQRLVVDQTPLRVRADREPRYADPVAARVDARRDGVVVEPAPVVPGEEDRGAVPVRSEHGRVAHPRREGLAGADRPRRMLARAHR